MVISDDGLKASNLVDSAPAFLGVYGDPVVGRALVLLLRGSGYEARFVSPDSLEEPGVFEGVRLLLLTSELDPDQRRSLLTSLRNSPGVGRTPVLELTVVYSGASEERQEGHRHMVPWPCSTSELERRIEGALGAGPGSPAR